MVAPVSRLGRRRISTDCCNPQEPQEPQADAFKVVPTRPRILYGIAFSAIAGSLAVRIALWNVPLLHAVDGLVGLVTVLWTAYNILMQHLKTPAQQRDVPESPDMKDLTHCLVVLHATEPEDMLYNIIEQLANQRALGKKVLLIAMEACTPHQATKIQTIKEKFGRHFSEILVSVHQLKEGEIVGTGSNHCAAQKVAARHFEKPENVIMSKFDANVCIAGNLLQEIEMHWLQSDAKSRASVTFIPRVAWSMATTDSKRCLAEIAVSSISNPFLCLAPYAMSFVSGSLEGARQVGFTPPSMLAEDELVWTKKALLLDGASSCRLSAFILKYHEAKEMSSLHFMRKVYLCKMKRWIVGWVETQDYIFRWAFDAIDGHPSVSPGRVAQVVLRNVLQWHMFFLMPFNAVLIPILGAPHDSCLALTVFTQTLIFLLILMVQIHLYQSFDFLGFDWRVIPSILLGAQILYPILPCFMLWVFVKHSLLDQAVGHTQTASTRSRTEMQSEPLRKNSKGVRDMNHALFASLATNSPVMGG